MMVHSNATRLLRKESWVATLFSFSVGNRGMASVVRMDNGDPVHISVRGSGVIVRHSRLGFLGAKLYESTSYDDAASTAKDLHGLYCSQLTPPGMNEPVLMAFTKAVLHCSTVAEIMDILNTTDEETTLEISPATG